MSNFTVNGVYSYTSANIYSYLGRVPTNSAALERAFDDFDITPTGKTDDLKKLNAAMYEEYSSQVQEQIKIRIISRLYLGQGYVHKSAYRRQVIMTKIMQPLTTLSNY